MTAWADVWLAAIFRRLKVLESRGLIRPENLACVSLRVQQTFFAFVLL